MKSQKPQFRRIDIVYKDWFENITRNFVPYSDQHFSSMWFYNADDDFQFAEVFGNLAIVMKDYITSKPFITFIGNKNITQTAILLTEYAREHKINTELKLIPEDVIELERNTLDKYFEIIDDRDNYDYIYSLKNLKELSGNRLFKHKSLINQFKRNFLDYQIQVEYDKKLIRDMEGEITTLFRKWEHNKDVSSEKTKTELTALKRLFRDVDRFELFVTTLRINTELIAFSINETVPGSDFCVGHFGKMNKNYRGAYQLVENEAVKHLYDLGYKYINNEQDMGIEGLRKAKMLLYPVRYLKKYTLRRRVDQKYPPNL